MRLVVLLILLLVGCASDVYIPHVPDSIARLPRKWEVPVVYVRLPENMAANDYRIEIAKALCREFAIRLYDAFDGQVYVKEFVICNPSLEREREPGMINLFNLSQFSMYRNETYMGNAPIRPGYSYVRLPDSMSGVDLAASTMLHEWMHSYIGLGDEYKHAHEPGNTRTTHCPLDPYTTKGIDDHACVMDDGDRRELCRAHNHNPDTDQGKEPCYEHAARVLMDSRIAWIVVPRYRIQGPINPPTPVIEVRLK